MLPTRFVPPLVRRRYLPCTHIRTAFPLIRRFVQRTKELVALVKAQIAELVDIAGSVRLWLQFSIPPAGGQDFDAKIKAHGSPLHPVVALSV